MTSEQIKTITVDGIEHQLDIFPKEVQQLVSIHQQWEAKLIDRRLDLALVEAAIRDLTRELSAKIKEHLSAVSDEQIDEDTPQKQVKSKSKKSAEIA